MKYEEYEKRKKKDKEVEKLKSTQSVTPETSSFDACCDDHVDLQGEIKGTETTLWRQRWWRLWRSKRPSSNT